MRRSIPASLPPRSAFRSVRPRRCSPGCSPPFRGKTAQRARHRLPQAMRIGVDFDNTLVSYDRAFATVGKEEGLLPGDFVGGKDAAKRRLYRERPDGYLWERLQGLVYGRRIDRAELYEGAAEFFRQCRAQAGWQVYIISHKTVLAHHDPLRTNLRDSAFGWMQRQGFFDARGFGLTRSQVFFEDSRDAKVRRI